jgi:molecular chaperone GrpE
MQHRVDIVEPQADEASSWEVENLREPFVGETTPDGHLAAQLEQSRLQMKRLASDFANMRRRNQAERSRTILYANEALLRQLLPIVDDFRLGLGQGPVGTADGSTEGGLRMVLDRLDRTLSSQGLKQIDPAGATFDPALHEAVRVKSDVSAPAGTVLETVRIGYSLHGKLIRAAQVVISPLSNGPQRQPRESVREEIQRTAPLVEQSAPEQVVRTGGSLVIEEELLEELEALSLGDLIPPE